MSGIHGLIETAEYHMDGLIKDPERPNIICITTCRSRCSHKLVKNLWVSRRAQLWLDRVQHDISETNSIDGISGYVIEICSLKFNNTKLSKTQFISKIKQFNAMINSDIPVLWITHANVPLTLNHAANVRKSRDKDSDDIIDDDNRLIDRRNIDMWISEALEDCKRSTILKPSVLLKGFDSEKTFQNHEHSPLGVDLAHYDYHSSVICIEAIKKHIKMLFADEK